MIVRPELQPAVLAPAPELRPGANVRMGRNPLGTWMEGPGGAGDFRHPFTVTASAVARVSKGLILADIAVEPLIGSVPIGGDAKRPQPTLKLSSSASNRLGESWICVEVTPDEEGKLDPEGKRSKVEVVQRESPFVTLGATGRAPLALLVYKDERPQVFQIAMFHLRYETSLNRETGERKHFFL
jgi:hypothetical protein